MDQEWAEGGILRGGRSVYRRSRGREEPVETIITLGPVSKAKADRHAQDVLPIIDDIRAGGISTLEGIAAELNARGILTAQDAQWYPTTVRNLLARSDRLL